MKNDWYTVWKADIEVDMRVEALDAPKVIVPGGQPHKMFRFVSSKKRNGAVVIVKKADKIALVKHKRFAIEITSLELPQGMGDATDKDGIETGVREAYEELGFIVNNAKNLGYIFADSAITANKINVIICDYIKETGITDGEVDSVDWYTKSEVKTLISKNKIKDGISIAALMKYFIEEEEI